MILKNYQCMFVYGNIKEISFINCVITFGQHYLILTEFVSISTCYIAVFCYLRAWEETVCRGTVVLGCHLYTLHYYMVTSVLRSLYGASTLSGGLKKLSKT